MKIYKHKSLLVADSISQFQSLATLMQSACIEDCFLGLLAKHVHDNDAVCLAVLEHQPIHLS